MEKLIREIRCCDLCLPHLPNGANPIVAGHPESKIALISQAPGSVAHASGVAWWDKSGHRLREWLGVDDDTFYNPKNFAIVPMGFCYPGRGKSGDLPPRMECAPLWHDKLLRHMPNIKLTLLIGSYSQSYYLGGRKHRTLTETVRHFNDYLPKYLPLPHPSPRNNIWLKKNAWFEVEVLPYLKAEVQAVL